MQNTINQTNLPIEIQDLLQFVDLKENQKILNTSFIGFLLVNTIEGFIFDKMKKQKKNEIASLHNYLIEKNIYTIIL